MLKKPLVALCSALMVSSVYVAPVSAQSRNSDNANEPQVTDGSGGRTGRARRNANRQAPAQPTPEQIKADAEAVLASANTACTVTDQRLLGATADGAKFFEVACDAAPGYLLISSTPPQVIDCIVVDHSNKQTTAEALPEGQNRPKCELPGNQDIEGFIKGFAAQAQVPCTVDQAAVKGQSNSGAVIYEIGCTNADGYWIEKEGTSWKKTECLQLNSQQATCNFTTKDEQITTVKSWLAGSEAAGCNVGDFRLMGQNANGRFIEVTCNGGEGLIFRHNAEFQVQQVYPCATAQAVGDGCQLPANKPETVS